MKKLISIIIATVSALCMLTPVSAYKIGDYIGTVYHTDIVAYINNYAIPSYAANGTSVVVAEDLRNFGFDVVWDNDARTLSISRNSDTTPVGMEFVKDGTPSMPFTSILYTDIVVYANGEKVPSYAINGYTMIPMESLTMLGEYEWVEEERALKMWVEGLDKRSEKQPIQSSLQYGRSIKPGAQNLISGLSAQERYELNVFLSNFVEIGFQKFDVESPVNEQLIYFGCMHHACNHTSDANPISDSEASKYIALDDYYINSCYKVSKDAVQASVGRYFGKKGADALNHTTVNMPNDAYRGRGEYAFNNGYYYFDYGEEGGIDLSAAVVDSMYLNNDGSYTVTFKGYGYGDLRLVPEIYYYTAEQAASSNRGRLFVEGKAIVFPFEYNGRNTYQLVRYESVEINR